MVTVAPRYGLAALAAGLQADPGDEGMEALERISLNLDVFAPHLFGGLHRLLVQEFLGLSFSHDLQDIDTQKLNSMAKFKTRSTKFNKIYQV